MKRPVSKARVRRRQGFTLLELLVATLAFSCLVGAVYAVFASGIRLRNDAVARIRAARLRARAAGLVRSDLRNALLTGGMLANELLGRVQSEDYRFPGYLSFTTTSARLAEGEMGGDVQRVTYLIRAPASADDGPGGTLVRAVERNLLAPVYDQPPETALLSRVERLEIVFFDGQEWLEAWDSLEREGEVPQAVRVRILQAAAEGAVRPPPIEVVVPWPMQPVSSEAAGTGATSDTGVRPRGLPGAMPVQRPNPVAGRWAREPAGRSGADAA
ncbi:MAG: prepilin-type N-terminal cleavage/methylation domain-containing protein [Kiritimatiellae bacterium]|nr:prepilin-type N-terminal cleavage/methylation domain-containing protein [Kiritimatiellia bacterium]